MYRSKMVVMSIIAMGVIGGREEAKGGMISVTNAGFEDATGQTTTNGVMFVNGWTSYVINTRGSGGGFIGTADNGPSGFPSTPTNMHFALANDPGNGLYQDVGALLADTTYTLTVAVGSRSGLESAETINLINGTNPTGTVESTNTQPASFAGTSLTDISTTFTTGNVVSGDLTIFLENSLSNNESGTPRTGIQADFDNVRLEADSIVATPEPGVMGLLGLGVVAMFRRRGLRSRQSLQ